jgi:hypothetical protein
VGTAPGDEGKKASFSEVARITFGKGWAMRLFDVSGRHQFGDPRSVVKILTRR